MACHKPIIRDRIICWRRFRPTFNRGHITVLDRPRLEQLSCECYAVVKKETDRLLPYLPPIAHR